VARLFEAFRVGDTDAFDDLIVDDYVQHDAQAANGLQAAKDYFAPVGPVDVEVHRMITEGDLVAVHSNYKTWNSPTRSHAQSLAQSTIDGHSQAEPHQPRAAARGPGRIRRPPAGNRNTSGTIASRSLFLHIFSLPEGPFPVSSVFSSSFELDEQEVKKMHEQRRPDKTIRVPLQDPAERPCELNHGCGSHLGWRRFRVFVESRECSVDDDAGIALG
jgi:predicted SnoaL-like aldol condensation-catalyzing enzyme